MKTPEVICWFRQDLRCADNPALYQAAQQGIVLPVYILDDSPSLPYKMGAASRLWLHASLLSLNKSLQQTLSLYRGDSLSVLLALCQQYGIKKVFWNRCYDKWSIGRDTKIKQQLKAAGIAVYTHNSALLWEPWEVKKEDETPYKVFTPFYNRGCLNALPPREPLGVPEKSELYKDARYAVTIEDLALLPKKGWDKKIQAHWVVGEPSAHQRLTDFIQNGLAHYKEGRDFPAKPYVSRLAPHLHFGEISPNQIWSALKQLPGNEQIDHFCRELAWREFSHHLLYAHPDLPEKNLQQKFDRFLWQSDRQHLHAWQQGKTGIPLVDAGMRELWQTGYMHNRVRMVVASFLVKNLRIDWRYGAAWFWDCLLDADLANNSASWQWVAGCGADAAPYFRIFNPVTQAKKFDPEGEYIRQYVPELKNLPNNDLFSPWEASAAVLKEAGITLGIDYPKPVVDLKSSRIAALTAFKQL